LLFDSFDKGHFQFLGWVSRKVADFAVQVDFQVIRAVLESRALLRQPPYKLTLFHRTSFCCFDEESISNFA
jgi:hypothetical protein